MRTSKGQGPGEEKPESTPIELRARTPGTHAQHAAGGLSSQELRIGTPDAEFSQVRHQLQLGNPGARAMGGANRSMTEGRRLHIFIMVDR